MSVKTCVLPRRRRFLTTTYATTSKRTEPRTPPTISPALLACDEEANGLSIVRKKGGKLQ